MMKDSLAAFTRYGLMSLVLMVISIFALATPVSAQLTGEARQSETNRRPRINTDRDLAYREWLLRNIGKVVRKDVNVQPPRVTLGNIKEDYEGLQMANNSILKMLSENKGLDYKLIADASTQIKKRTTRLKSYLVILKIVAEDKKREKSQDEIGPDRMKSSLLTLDASIVRLITNPVFQNIGQVMDVDDSTRALVEMEAIIELSERIKRTAERSMKEVRASR